MHELCDAIYHTYCLICRLVGAHRLREVEASLGAEDFSFYSHAGHVPSTFLYLGIRNESSGSTHGEHTSRFKIDESVLSLGAALHVALATEYLNMGLYDHALGDSSKAEL